MGEEYGEKIQVLSIFEGIRKRPRLYFQQCFESENLNRIPLEVACHAFDEIVDGSCKSLSISVDKEIAIIEYDVGMSLDKEEYCDLTRAEIIMTQIRACSNLKKHLSVGDDLCQIGIAAINAVCKYCELEIVSNNQKANFRFEEGLTVQREFSNCEHQDYTKITIKPDYKVFKNLKFSYEGVLRLAEEYSKKLDGFEIRVLH